MDPTTHYICIDQVTSLEAAIDPSLRWDNGDELHVTFLEGSSDEIQKKVAFYAHQWEKYANIRFVFDNRPDAQIRIAFKPGGSWSLLGKQALDRPRYEATMNFGWLTTTPIPRDEVFSQVVLHEFGHALGLIHEHQSPATGIQWDKPAVIQTFIEMSKQTSSGSRQPDPDEVKQWVEENIFRRYTFSLPRRSLDIDTFTEFDPLSIMVYHISKEWTIDKFETPWNTTLSQRDKEFIRLWYPGRSFK